MNQLRSLSQIGQSAEDGGVARTQFLQIRVTPEEKKRVEAAAQSTYLDSSTWARMVILRAIDEAEARDSKE